MKVVVSGGTGFLGEEITRALLKKGYPLRVLSRDLQKARALFLAGEVEIFTADIRNPETLEKALEGYEVVVQCAQFPGHPVEQPRKGYTYWKVDAVGTENLAKAAKAAGIKHFVYLSGAGTDKSRTEPWFRAKWYAEQAIHSSGIPATILKPSWVYGPKDKSLNRIIAQLKYLPLFPLIGGGRNHVQPIFVGDLAEIVAQLVATAGPQDRTFDCGGPQELKMKTMLKTVANVLGKRRVFFPVPKTIVKATAFFLQGLPNPPLNPAAVDFITMDTHINIGPLKKSFPGLKLKTLEEGLRSYLNMK